MNVPETDQPLVSIITLNYNKPQVTADFLASSRNLLYTNYEILVCDMGSAEDPRLFIDPSVYPNTRVLVSQKNLGFAGGNNWGIHQAKGDFIFVVNNDTELTPEIIRLLLEPFYQNSAIGVVSPKIKYFDDRNRIQYAGFRPMNPYTGRTSTIGNLEEDRGQYDISGTTAGAHGCAMMIKRQALEITGMFPVKFFLYYEEWDLSARMERAGFLIWYQAKATIYHKDSLTVGRESPLKLYYHTRNRILFMRRNSRPFQLIVFTLFFCFISVPKTVFYFLIHGRFAYLKSFLKAVFFNLNHSGASIIN